jgi:site-specific DNA recombinase
MNTSTTKQQQQQTAVIYGRVSSEEQVQGYSIQAQLRACREWAEKHGYTVAKEYLDEGYSAFRKLEKREALKELLTEAVSKQRAFQLVIVHKLDRLFRNTLESSTTRAILKREKVRLISVTEPMVGSDAPEDFFMEHLLVGMAEFYSRNLSREIMKGLKQRALQGHLVFRPPFGFKREVIERQNGHKRTRIISRAVIDEKNAAIVKHIFELFDHGNGYKKIIATLNHEGHRTEQGLKFRVYHISKILRNRAYIGILEYNLRQDRGHREPFNIPGFYPQIIEETLFNRVQEKLTETAKLWHNSYAHKTEYLLSRLVVCDTCGHHYVGTSAKSGRVHYYSCQSYMKRGKAGCDSPLLNKVKLETAVLDHVQDQILSEENVRKYIQLVLERSRSDNQKPSAEETAITLAIADADAKLRRWEDALERGLLTIEDAAHRIKAIRHERVALLKTKAELARKSQPKGKIVPIPTELMSAYIREMQARLRTKKIGYKREFLREIIKEVRVRGREITLSYRIPLNPPKSPAGATRGGFFTVSGMVVAVGIEPTTSRM